MNQILQFAPRARPPAHKSGTPGLIAGTASVIIFPGVRYERDVAVAPAAQPTTKSDRVEH